MKLVIDISEEHYNSIVSGNDIEIYYGEHFVTKDSWASELIRKGTPLEQEPKTGHWKPFDLTYGRSIYYCTACRESTELPTCMGKPLYKFCPNCGAKMAESEEDNEPTR